MPHAGQHARRQLAVAVGFLQDAVVHALSCLMGRAPLWRRHSLGLGQDAGEVGRAPPCERMVLQSRGGRGGGRAGRGGGQRGGQGRRGGVPETAAAAAAGGVGGSRGVGALAEQQQLLQGDLAVGGF